MSEHIKTWRERVTGDSKLSDCFSASLAEIAELRAELNSRCRAQGGITNDSDSNSLATQPASTAPGQADILTFTVDGVVMSQLEYIDYLHGQLAVADRDAAIVESIRAAIKGYYRALCERQHGGVAQDRAFGLVQLAMGMSWDDYKAEVAALSKEKP